MGQPTTWKCEVCGYVHRGSTPPARCPICGVGSELFSALEIVAAAPTDSTAGRWRCTVCDHVHEGIQPPADCPICSAEASLFEPYQRRRHPAAAQGPTVERLVIVGAGIAGVTAAEQARRTAPKASVTLVSKEPGLPYYRLNLTRLLGGEVEKAALQLHPASWYGDQRIELVHDDGGVAAIHRQERQLELGGGRKLPYDRLVLAMGAHPFVPPIPGATREGVLVLRTEADVSAILGRAAPQTHCVCIGGGVLGLETAGALRRKGLRVTVLESFDWLLPRQLAEPAGRLLQKAIEEKGIAVRCGVRIEELAGDEEVRGVRIEGGEDLPAELVVLAAGVRPNSYLARLGGLQVGRGVLVDDRMATSDPAIFAAGDVAEHRGVVYGLWPHAYAQGVVAGANAAGGELEFRGLAPSNRLKVQDVDLFSIGEFQRVDGSYCLVEQQDEGAYYRLVVHDGRLVGANLLGDTDLAGSLKTWIEQGTQVAELPDLQERFPRLGTLCRSRG